MCAEKGTLRKQLIAADYDVLPINAWNTLVGWYGVYGDPIERQVQAQHSTFDNGRRYWWMGIDQISSPTG